jgi:hypothetical protein
MAKTHIVEQGDTLSSIAQENGFANFRTLLDLPENAALKEKRKNAHILFPGDEVFIPDREERQEDAATGGRHIFLADAQGLFLRIKVLDHDRNKLKEDTEVQIFASESGEPITTNPDGEGIVEAAIPRDTGKAELDVPEKKLKMDLIVGGLDPIDTLSGQRARLHNLGYFAGFASDDTDQFRWAAEEFKKDKKVTPLAVKKEDIDPVEGITDPKFRDKLETEHGS